ncbi:MAG: hypothetical protein JXB10_19790 [Pirellulales bacterium]|nr:hypothetical protein [Pirellulales bacterium]
MSEDQRSHSSLRLRVFARNFSCFFFMSFEFFVVKHYMSEGVLEFPAKGWYIMGVLGMPLELFATEGESRWAFLACGLVVILIGIAHLNINDSGSRFPAS